MQVTVDVNDAYLRSVLADVLTSVKEMKQVARTASWDTTKQVKTRVSKLVRDRVAIKKKDLDPHLTATRHGDGGVVRLKESRRIPLREFGAKDTKKKGVTYKIDKNKPRQRIKDAFAVSKFGGHIYRRVGKKRLPIRKLYGVSAWGVIVKNNYVPEIETYARERLQINLTRRVNLQVLRRTGVVKH